MVSIYIQRQKTSNFPKKRKKKNKNYDDKNKQHIVLDYIGAIVGHENKRQNAVAKLTLFYLPSKFQRLPKLETYKFAPYIRFACSSHFVFN